MTITLPVRSYPLFIEPRAVRLTSNSDKAEGATRHVIFIHGWNADSASLGNLYRATERAPEAQGWQLWNIDFPTHRWSFARGAKEIVAALRETGADFNEVILVGFSMGGVVARQMVADGFPCKALIAIASPHQGVVRWVTTHSPGTVSIHRRSKQLAALNANPADIAARGRYHFFSITYSNMLGHHPHDGLVSKSSALGSRLGPVAERKNVHFDLGRKLVMHGPHLRGMSAIDMAPAMEAIRRAQDKS